MVAKNEARVERLATMQPRPEASHTSVDVCEGERWENRTQPPTKRRANRRGKLVSCNALLGGVRLCSELGGSDTLNPYALRVRSQCFKVAWIRSEDSPSWFGGGNDQRVDSGASTSVPSQECCAPGQSLAHLFHNVAGFEECVLGGVTSSVPLQTLHEHDGWNRRRP
jgi:hypothetical protein